MSALFIEYSSKVPCFGVHHQSHGTIVLSLNAHVLAETTRRNRSPKTRRKPLDKILIKHISLSRRRRTIE